MILMVGKSILPQKYGNLGFEISGLGLAGSALRYRGKTIFVFSSGFDAQSDLVAKLCEAYLKNRPRIRGLEVNGNSHLMSSLIPS